MIADFTRIVVKFYSYNIAVSAAGQMGTTCHGSDPAISTVCRKFTIASYHKIRRIGEAKFDNDMTMTMTMKIILLPCNTCGIHSYSRTLTCYIQQSVMEI